MESWELEPEGDEGDVEAAWRQEVVDRVAALEAGNIKMTPWEEIRAGFVLRLRECHQG
jgi:hypothetical protein